MAALGLWGVLWLGSAVFLIITIILLVWNYARLPPNFSDKGLLTTIIITATFSMWLMWAIVYISQMYPIPGVAPELLVPNE
mmetsp:Transcript_35139/g.56851  ORF Transcript_35139/g.56851 Transcript_35139/m.56851 type:complete len:81 (+) Transcript_35139:86-328(+)